MGFKKRQGAGRSEWLADDDTPLLQQKLEELDSFTSAMADGVIDKKEIAHQEQLLVSAMRLVEATLDDEQHEKVTQLLVELTAYNIMNVLHGLAQARPKR